MIGFRSLFSFLFFLSSSFLLVALCLAEFSLFPPPLFRASSLFAFVPCSLFFVLLVGRWVFLLFLSFGVLMRSRWSSVQLLSEFGRSSSRFSSPFCALASLVAAAEPLFSRDEGFSFRSGIRAQRRIFLINEDPGNLSSFHVPEMRHEAFGVK